VLERRRMFSANVGEVFILPTREPHLLRSDVVLSRRTRAVRPISSDDVLELGRRERCPHIRTPPAWMTLQRCADRRGARAAALGQTLRTAYLQGFLRGVARLGRSSEFREARALCEMVPGAVRRDQTELYLWPSTDLFSDVEVTI